MSGFGVSVKAEMTSKSWMASAEGSGGEAELKSVFLHPGEMYASVEPANITIILGSWEALHTICCRRWVAKDLLHRDTGMLR
jgi:hypothetical protein